MTNAASEPSRELITGLDYSYVDQVVHNIRASLSIEREALPLKPGVLLSIHLQSNRPDNFSQFLDELEASLDDPANVEVVVKIDDTDMAMNELLPREIAKRPFVVKYISTPLVGGFFELWRSMNDMLKVCDPNAYFLWNMNDEMAILNKGWDTALSKYVGLFPDHIFRLRTSLFRFRNYYDFWECGFAPETSAITTKRWIDIGGGWNPCLGPDSFQQCVSYYFGYHDRFNKFKTLRDVPIHDILLAGEGAFVGLEGEQLWRRMRGAVRAWYRLMSYEIQTDASRRSQKLLAHIWAHDQNLENFTVEDDERGQEIIVRNEHGKRMHALPYALPRLRTKLTNLWRVTHYFYYGGGGAVGKAQRLKRFITFCTLWCNSLEWIRRAYMGRKERLRKAQQRRAERRNVLREAVVNRFVYWPGIEAYRNGAISTRRMLSVLLWHAMRAFVVKGFNRGIRFHKSVFVFDSVERAVEWRTLLSIMEKVKWPRHFAAERVKLSLLRCLLLQHWYSLTDEALEVALGRDLAFQRFTLTPLNAPQPSLALISEFRELLQKAEIEFVLYRKADLFIDRADLPACMMMEKAA